VTSTQSAISQAHDIAASVAILRAAGGEAKSLLERLRPSARPSTSA
jgi:hypothetical protein